jgi:hypothetical protein
LGICEIGSRVLPRPAWPTVLLVYTSYPCWDDRHVLRCPAIGWDRSLWTFCPGWPWTVIFLILASQVAVIIGMNHWHLAPVWQC